MSRAAEESPGRRDATGWHPGGGPLTRPHRSCESGPTEGIDVKQSK